MSIHTEKNGPVTTIIMERPNVRNAVDPETADALVAAFDAFNRDAQAKVAVFFGSHGTFCAGWDLKYGASLAGKDARRELDLDFPQGAAPVPRGPMGPSRLELDKPVIGAVAGAAVAGGMELALWCDMRVMEEDAYFGVYCRRWGVPLIDGGTVRLMAQHAALAAADAFFSSRAQGDWGHAFGTLSGSTRYDEIIARSRLG